ncbi:MAG: DNA replication/repair protein RecF [Polyangiales bacterium]
MILRSIRLRGFRNLIDQQVDPIQKFNVFFGDNGAGKSNLLEAIYYLGSLRSFRQATRDDLIRLNESEATIDAFTHDRPLDHRLTIQLSRSSARQMRLDEKRPKNKGLWHQCAPMVLFAPSDIRLASGGPDSRRTYVDGILEQIDPIYANTLAAYDKALRSRNRLLKDERADARAIRAFDAILSEAGSVIVQSRATMLSELAPEVMNAFEKVLDEEIPFSIEYKPRVDGGAESIRARLEEAYAKDRARGFTADGPHADDILLHIKGGMAKQHASQGQQRAIVLAMKIAELHMLTKKLQRLPALLLDDVSSELDQRRNRQLFSLLSALGGQVFLTTTHREYILLDGERKDFCVKSGAVSAV